ncbi:MAG: folate family ECF transporter S component [Oscillospiraceae bacterium]|jgi:ECF transporter S component (folate family)|nr:folate family ECF transporter S component [Oscillospiraceae bacterium]
MRKWNVNTLCTLALLTAMMVLLSLTLAVRTDYFKLTFGSLPVVLAAMLFGPLEGIVVAVLGEFMVQLLTFGLMPTTVIWILPPAIRAVVVGLAAVQLRKTGVPLERRPALCYIVCIAGAVLTTTGNTLGMWLDSLVYHTSFSAALFIAPARYVSGVVTAAVIATLSMPLVHLLRRSGVLNEVRHDGP